MFGRITAASALLVVGLVTARSDELAIADLVRDAALTPLPALPPDLLNIRVGNGADASTDRDYVYAGWSLSAGRFDTLHVLAVDRQTGAWKHRGFKEDPNGHTALAGGGSVVDVRTSPHFITLEMHHNPSASTTWVLRRDLARAGAFYGWIKEFLPNELMVYEHSQIHVAPTHYVEISIFDPVAARSRRIYPIEGGTAVRRAFVAGVKARWDSLGEDWFRTHNHHGDPERFDSSAGRFATDWAARGLAFEVSYEDFTGTSGTTSAATARVVVSCDGLDRASTVRCGESAESDWAAALPDRDAAARLREAAAHPRLVPWK